MHLCYALFTLSPSNLQILKILKPDDFRFELLEVDGREDPLVAYWFDTNTKYTDKYIFSLVIRP